ncbi:endonuclease/exonuclease/phosphatase family protein [Methylicorpusculum oleiharenae]|uniref:endonuclease/exonuclease/phosphatase family protein n=1 Tax=Methylicorpusculum oleiharenae TaxID=1338687 RepID=UPI0013568714|nr:endonuclease/exonuclease/phosphatase family protein [Methylicorpusculum oleiharenae]MCD2452566.1 endonuclease/exonuclease/phosphatase family protein [Methylicorpusculum oleiharenae]
MTDSTFRVLTYNIHKGFNVGNRRFVLHQIREALIEADADLLFLQEMQGEHVHKEKHVPDWPDRPQVEFIAEGVWPHYAYGKNAIYTAGHHGNALLSKYPFESFENINVSPFSWASRSLLHGVIRVKPDVQPLHVVCIHFGLTGKERRLQLERLCQRIESHVPHDAPLIVAGDFNDWLGHADRHFYEHLGLKEVFKTTHGRYAKTFPAWLPVLTMDRIYFRGLTPLSCNRLAHSPWHALSDHAPLAGLFEL